jgi:hypothetical protein
MKELLNDFEDVAASLSHSQAKVGNYPFTTIEVKIVPCFQYVHSGPPLIHF